LARNYVEQNTSSLQLLMIDTNILFSALHNRKGKEALLFELADRGKCSILIFDYVLDEFRAVFRRKGKDFKQIDEMLETYENVHLSSLLQLVRYQIPVDEIIEKGAGE